MKVEEPPKDAKDEEDDDDDSDEDMVDEDSDEVCYCLHRCFFVLLR